MNNWQPIETAPKDGTRVRLLCDDKEDSGYWDDYTKRGYYLTNLVGEWNTEKGEGEPTHWMPLKKSESISGWQPMETAPKDEKPILCVVHLDWADNYEVATWAPNLGRWIFDSGRYGGNPKCWMPLPEIPK